MLSCNKLVKVSSEDVALMLSSASVDVSRRSHRPTIRPNSLIDSSSDIDRTAESTHSVVNVLHCV